MDGIDAIKLQVTVREWADKGRRLSNFCHVMGPRSTAEPSVKGVLQVSAGFDLICKDFLTYETLISEGAEVGALSDVMCSPKVEQEGLPRGEVKGAKATPQGVAILSIARRGKSLGSPATVNANRELKGTELRWIDGCESLSQCSVSKNLHHLVPNIIQEHLPLFSFSKPEQVAFRLKRPGRGIRIRNAKVNNTRGKAAQELSSTSPKK